MSEGYGCVEVPSEPPRRGSRGGIPEPDSLEPEDVFALPLSPSVLVLVLLRTVPVALGLDVEDDP